MKHNFVQIKNGKLYDHLGKTLILEGVGLNAWLLPEGYMFKNYKDIDRPRRFYEWTKKLLGIEESNAFWNEFRKRFITENDIKLIKQLGFNSIRIPFDYEILFHPSEMDEVLTHKEDRFHLIDQVLNWCETHQLYAILDLHAAPGGQTGANIDNSKHDRPELFELELYQKQTINLWRFIADRYKDHVWIACYDLLNEPLPSWFSKHNYQVMPLYQKMIKAIREVDEHHLISIEGVHWATDFSIFDEKPDEGIFPQFHKYWSPFDIESILPFIELAKQWEVPLLMGEGGEHYLLWYSGAFKMYRQLGISWNFWSYKKMKTDNSISSFKEPDSWEKCFSNDLDISKDDVKKIFDELLDNIRIESCEINTKVVNHLFQKDEFETFGIAFDFDINKIVNQVNHHTSFRTSENVVCCDEEGNEIVPDFSIRKRPGENTKFPYLKMNINQSYSYQFYTSRNEIYKIDIEGLKLQHLTIYIDQELIQNVSSNYMSSLKYKLSIGEHTLTIISSQLAYIKKIIFINIENH